MASKRGHSGCVYWPRRKGPFFLGDETFDQPEVSDELEHLASLGFDFARIVVPWAALQPEPERLRSSVIDRMILLLDAAADAGLVLHLTLLGQLGGTLFLPQWLLAMDPLAARRPAIPRVITNGWESLWEPANLYGRRPLVEAQQHVWGRLATHLGDHPALGALDAGAGGLLSAVPPANPDEALGWWDTLASGAQSEHLMYSDSLQLLFQAGAPSLAEWAASVKTLALSANPYGSADRARGGGCRLAALLGSPGTGPGGGRGRLRRARCADPPAGHPPGAAASGRR